MNPVIAAIDDGCVTEYKATRFTGGQPTHLVPTVCKKHKEPWPCKKIMAAREQHAREMRQVVAA